MRNIFTITSLILFGLCFTSCKEENNPIPPEEQPQVNLTLEDTSCTEAWIKLSTSSLALPSDLDLYRDSSFVETINLTSEDTVLYVDSLLPNHTYKYQSVIQSTGQSGNQLSVNTLDTTSHNRSWEVFLFGEYAQSIIKDIAIIDENNIWAVGEIYMLDSLGQQDPKRYNLAVWNGNNWKIKRVPYYYQGQPFYNPIRSVFAFGANDIWFCGNGLINWNGNQYNPVPIPWGPYWMNKIWGTSDNDLYVVGDNGNIAHHQNGNWSLEESGTTVDLLDIWGGSDGTLWSCGYTSNYSTTVLLRNAGSGWVKVYEGDGLDLNNGYHIGLIGGVWSANDHRVYLMDNVGVFLQRNSNQLNLENEIINFTHFSYDIDGTDDNNIFICGDWFVGHWNGMTFREYPAVYQEHRKYYSIKVKGNTVCAGGTDYNGPIFSKAVIILSK